MTLRRKIATSILLILAMAPVFYAISFQFNQARIRHQMREALERSALHEIKIEKDQLHWARFEKELVIDDKLFDVKGLTYHQDGSATAKGLFDDQETTLVQQLNKQQQENNSQGSKLIAQFFQIWMAVPGDHGNLGLEMDSKERTLYPLFKSDIASASKLILTPPPQA